MVERDSDSKVNFGDRIIHISRSIVESLNSQETPRDDKNLSKDDLAEAIKVLELFNIPQSKI